MRTIGIHVFAGLILVPDISFAHGGGLNKEGCHNDRKNGGYHCHGSRTSASRATMTASTKKPVKAQGLMATETYYPNCSTARAAGVAPIKRGDPGYSRKLDRDGDGVACE